MLAISTAAESAFYRAGWVVYEGNNAVRKGISWVSILSSPWQIRELNKFLAFSTLIARARDTVYTEGNVKKVFESTEIHPLNPRTGLVRC